MALPLRARDLSSREVNILSYAGAHSFLDTSEKLPGIPSLCYRQFTDFMPGGPLLSPSAEVQVIGEDGRPAECHVLDYMWRPDFIRSRYRLGTAAEITQVLAYTDEGTCLCEVKLKSLTGRSLHIRVVGAVSEKASANITRLPDRGFSVQVRAEMGNPEGVPPSKLLKTFTIAFSERPAHISVDGREYAAEFRLEAKKEAVLVVLCSENISKGKLANLLERPSKAVSYTAHDIDSWFAEAVKPSMKDPEEVKMYYNAWLQFWNNIEHPEGMWTRPVICPDKTSYGRGIRLRDSAFYAMALASGGERALELAKNQIRVLVEAGNRIGHLPGEVWADAVIDEIPSPGILTWAVMEIYQKTEDKQFLQDVYPALAKNNDWFYQEHDSNNNGLCERDGRDAVDLNSLLYWDQIKLADMCDLLGMSLEAAGWRSKAETTGSLVRDKMWNEEYGCFQDLETGSGELAKVMTPAAFLPMFAGIATKEQVRMLMKHLELAGNSYEITRNWLITLGLDRYGYKEAADELRDKIIKVITKNLAVHKYYNPETGEGFGAMYILYILHYLFSASSTTALSSA